MEQKMNNEINQSIPKWFWVISILALLWFLMDMSAYVMRTFMLQEMIVNMSEAHQRLYITMPSWVNAVFAAEVFGGLFGSICLLLKKRFALTLYLISLVGVLLQTSYVYFLSNAIKVMGTAGLIMPLIAIIIGLVMVVFSKSGISKGWLS